MAYSVTNPPQILVQSIGDTAPALWTYASADSAATINGTANYVTNGQALGMKVGDIMMALTTGSTVSTLRVSAVTASGASFGTGTVIGA